MICIIFSYLTVNTTQTQIIAVWAWCGHCFRYSSYLWWAFKHFLSHYARVTWHQQTRRINHDNLAIKLICLHSSMMINLANHHRGHHHAKPNGLTKILAVFSQCLTNQIQTYYDCLSRINNQLRLKINFRPNIGNLSRCSIITL